MKPWMKYLMWFLCGGGFGYFIGQQVGQKQAQRYLEQLQAADTDGDKSEEFNEGVENVSQKIREFNEAMLGYKEGLDEILQKPATDEEEPEMPTAEDIAIDPDIPQLHPEDLKPEIIGEEEYNANIWQYDLENLTFYELDEVLYDETTQSIIETPDQVIGIGTLFEFGGDPNNPTETIYVKNDTFGTLFRIDSVDAAFCDVVDGSCGPEDDPPEEEDDFDNDDYWNDV